MPQGTPEERELGRLEMVQHAADPKSKRLFEKLLRLSADKGEADQVGERLSWGIDVNCRSKRGRTPLLRNCSSINPDAATVSVLLKAGADPNVADDRELTALDYARQRLLKYEGQPRRKPRRSASLTPGGEVKLSPFENRMLERMHKRHPENAAAFEEDYLAARRRAAEKVFDPRGNLEKIVELLEPVTRAH